MKKIMFVCYGNICRSTMAEFLMKDLVSKKGKSSDFYIESSGTSNEEEGNPVHYGTRKILDRLGIDYSRKRARQLEKSDYDKYDYFIAMDQDNVREMKYLFSGDKDNKIIKLLDLTAEKRDVLDPWYTRDFEATYRDIQLGLNALYGFLLKE